MLISPNMTNDLYSIVDATLPHSHDEIDDIQRTVKELAEGRIVEEKSTVKMNENLIYVRYDAIIAIRRDSQSKVLAQRIYDTLKDKGYHPNHELLTVHQLRVSNVTDLEYRVELRNKMRFAKVIGNKLHFCEEDHDVHDTIYINFV